MRPEGAQTFLILALFREPPAILAFTTTLRLKLATDLCELRGFNSTNSQANRCHLSSKRLKTPKLVLARGGLRESDLARNHLGSGGLRI